MLVVVVAVLLVLAVVVVVVVVVASLARLRGTRISHLQEPVIPYTFMQFHALPSHARATTRNCFSTLNIARPGKTKSRPAMTSLVLKSLTSSSTSFTSSGSKSVDHSGSARDGCGDACHRARPASRNAPL